MHTYLAVDRVRHKSVSTDFLLLAILNSCLRLAFLRSVWDECRNGSLNGSKPEQVQSIRIGFHCYLPAVLDCLFCMDYVGYKWSSQWRWWVLAISDNSAASSDMLDVRLLSNGHLKHLKHYLHRDWNAKNSQITLHSQFKCTNHKEDDLYPLESASNSRPCCNRVHPAIRATATLPATSKLLAPSARSNRAVPYLLYLPQTVTSTHSIWLPPRPG